MEHFIKSEKQERIMGR